MINCYKSKKVLGWRPSLTADEAIKNSVEWYKRFYPGKEMFDFTINQIQDYQKRAEGSINEKIISKIN